VIHVGVAPIICVNATLTSLGEFHIINFLKLLSIVPPLEITYPCRELPSLRSYLPYLYNVEVIGVSIELTIDVRHLLPTSSLPTYIGYAEN
jgi:hypothetical protein